MYVCVCVCSKSVGVGVVRGGGEDPENQKYCSAECNTQAIVGTFGVDKVREKKSSQALKDIRDIRGLLTVPRVQHPSVVKQLFS